MSMERESDPYECAIDLMRRLPPKDVEKNFPKLINMLGPDIPDKDNLIEGLMTNIDRPLKAKRCEKTKKDYLLHEYNRDGDSYRSPWTNEYEPELPDGIKPSEAIRKLEIAANEMFDFYRERYYEGVESVSSVYAFLADNNQIAVSVLIQAEEGKNNSKSVWNSIHIFQIEERGRNAHYKLASTLMLHLPISDDATDSMSLCGRMTREREEDCPVDDPVLSHTKNMGRLVEDMERIMRNEIQILYFDKTSNIVNELREQGSIKEKDQIEKHQFNAMRELAHRG